MSEFPSESESERRRKVADEKMWGAIIETLEKMRKAPVAQSIMFRFYLLHQSIDEFQKTVKAMGKEVDPLRTIAPSFTKEQTNFLIGTYNNIIEDLHSHLGKKDAYVRKFSSLKKLEQPTINDVAKILFMMAMNVSQIIFYMFRWTG